MNNLNSLDGNVDFSDKVSIVTGAAGGIGAEIVKKLAQQGSIVVAVDLNQNGLNSVVNELQKTGYKVHAYAVDISSSSEVEAMVSEVESRFGPINYLVNGAGTLKVGQVTELTEEDWDITMRVNAKGVFLVSRTVARRMIANNTQGAIVTLASNAALVARMDMAAYSASKAAIISMTKCLGLELAEYGIRCNIVAPGSTDTDMLRSLWNGVDSTQISIDGSPETFRVGVPLGRIAQPDHVASTVLFLLSDQAMHITMETLTVDGGATLGV